MKSLGQIPADSLSRGGLDHIQQVSEETFSRMHKIQLNRFDIIDLYFLAIAESHVTDQVKAEGLDQKRTPSCQPPD